MTKIIIEKLKDLTATPIILEVDTSTELKKIWTTIKLMTAIYSVYGSYKDDSAGSIYNLLIVSDKYGPVLGIMFEEDYMSGDAALSAT